MMRRAKSDAVVKMENLGLPVELEPSKIPKKEASSVRRKSKSPSRKEPAKSPSTNVAFKSPKSKSPARRSPARTSTGQLKSENKPTKSKSPSRRSPSRRSPGRRSPGRDKSSSPKPKKKSVTNKATTRSISAEKKEKPQRDEVKNKKSPLFDESDSDLEVVQEVKVKTPSRSSSRKLDADGDSLKDKNWKIDTNNYSGITRRLVLGHDRELHEVKHVKSYDYLAKKLTELSDDDDVTQNRKSASREMGIEDNEIIEFGGRLGTLLLSLLLPVGVIGLHVSCNEYQCTFSKLPNLGNYKRLVTYFNLTTFLIYSAFVLILALLGALPLGGKKIVSLTTKQEKFHYRMNGLFSCFIVLAISIGLEVFRIPVFNYVYDHYFHFLISSITFGGLLSVYAYIRSFYVPKIALNTNALDSTVYGFFMGRETNPRLFGIVDLKTFVLRLLVIGTLILNTAILYKSLGISLLSNSKDVKNAIDIGLLNLQPTLLVLYVTQTIYVLDSLVFEPAWLSSFEVRYEGFGYMFAMGYAVYPFLITSITKYAYNYSVTLTNWQLAAVIAIYLCGYILNRGSNNQKNQFRRNPYSPGVAHLESIPTSQGKKLLISGFWGFVRHPNYLGDIILNLAWYPFVLCVPPAIFILFTILVLIHRASRDNVHCKLRYGPSWDRYCQKIKYKVIPKVY